jgi:hypothetical protein
MANTLAGLAGSAIAIIGYSVWWWLKERRLDREAKRPGHSPS